MKPRPRPVTARSNPYADNNHHQEMTMTDRHTTNTTPAPGLDPWQQPNGWPKDAYFEAVHDSLTTLGIRPDSWWHGDPWEGAVVLGEDALKGTGFEPYDEVVVSWRVDQDPDPQHCDDFEGEGWYLVLARGDNRQIRELSTPLPYLAEPEHVAAAVAEQLRTT